MAKIATDRLKIWTAMAVFVIARGHDVCAQTTKYRFHIFKAEAGASGNLVAVNSSGAKLFDWTAQDGASTCVVLKGGVQTTISDPNGANTFCTGIASNGGIVGFYTAGGSQPPYTGFAYLNGVFADVIPPTANPAWGSIVNAISPNGLMAGEYLAPDGNYPIFLTYGSLFETIEISGVTILDAVGVNDSGMVVGQEIFATMRGDYVFSVLIVNGVPSYISVPGSIATLAHNINDKGDVVGYYYNADYVEHGFIYSSSKNAYFAPIDVPGATQTSLTGITNDGVVTGAALISGATFGQPIIGFPLLSGANTTAFFEKGSK